MADPTPVLPNRDDLSEDFRDAWRARASEGKPPKVVDVSEGSIPYKFGEAVADVLLPLYANHDVILKSFVVKGTTGARLERLARERLLPNEDGSIRLPPTGGSGYMQVAKIVVGGAVIPRGTLLVHQASKTTVQVLGDLTTVYQDGDPVPIQCVTTGPATNLAQDTPLLFNSQPPGVSPGAVVLAQNDGTGNLVGLTGGRDGETDEELQDRIIEAQSEPPAAGNAAQIVQVAQRTGGVPVQRAFAISAWFGPGSISIPFVLRPDAAPSRIPNSTQRGLVEQAVRSAFPLDYSITVPTVLGQNLVIAVGVTWLGSARTWVDLTPWPAYVAADPVHVDAAGTLSNSMLRATTSTTTANPEVGQTVALYDRSTKAFKKKRISAIDTLISGKSWDLTFTSALGASDAFVPEDGALLCPYSPSLARLPTSVAAYCATLGPGEMFDPLPDPGARQRRWPFSPDAWPSVVTNEGLVTAVKGSGAVSDVEVLLPDVPYATTVGTPGVLVYLLQLTDFAAFPQT